MKKPIIIGLPAAAILGLGAMLLLPGDGADEHGDSTGGKTAARHAGKSDRAPERGGTPKRQALFDQVDQELHRLEIEHAEAPRKGRTFVLPPQVESERTNSRERSESIPTGDAIKPPTGASEGEVAVQGSGFADQVVRHNRDRKEFMRQRYQELASHQPGCKCAYHVGRK